MSITDPDQVPAVRERIASALRGADRILLACHVRPDGDAIGSVLGLASSLRALGKEVVALSEDGLPSDLDFLPGGETIVVPDGQPIEADLAVALDTATRVRLGERTNAAFAGARRLINIDHHKSNPGYGELNLIDPRSPATGQILAEMVRATGLPLPRGAQENFFVAISTDTGSFQYAGTSGDTLRLVADMVDDGLDLPRLNELTYMRQPLRKLRLLGELLAVLEIGEGGRIAHWSLTREAVRRLDLQPEDSEGLIDHLRAIRGVELAVFFEELDTGKVRVSSRSKNPALDVCAVCAHFGGGGHTLAAGARMAGPLADARERFLTQARHALPPLPQA